MSSQDEWELHRKLHKWKRRAKRTRRALYERDEQVQNAFDRFNDQSAKGVVPVEKLRRLALANPDNTELTGLMQELITWFQTVTCTRYVTEAMQKALADGTLQPLNQADRDMAARGAATSPN